MDYSITSIPPGIADCALRNANRWPAHLLATLLIAVCAADNAASAAGNPKTAESTAESVTREPTRSALRYDLDYPAIGYGEKATQNRVSRLQARLDRGELRLQYHPTRGYLDSVLKALEIDPSSQTLVYSKTSLQFLMIRPTTPRAIYFNEDTYVAWIPGTDFLEIATMDSALGPVFYTLPNRSPEKADFERATLRCLTCHDTFGMAGGGVPRFLFLSTLVDINGEALTDSPGKDTTDQTPLSERWGGWYVTGQHGAQVHLGNILVSPEEFTDVDAVRRGNIVNVNELFDASGYLRETSDIVALLVFEHQAYVHNFITRANYKLRTLVPQATAGTADHASLSPKEHRIFKALLDPLVRAMLFVEAAPLTDRITSSSGFDKWFASRGPRDARGRSLRDLDLNTRIFRYRMSFLIYSEAFDALPEMARKYLYARFADVLSGRDDSPAFSHLSTAERTDILAILTATKPEFATVAKQRRDDPSRLSAQR